MTRVLHPLPARPLSALFTSHAMSTLSRKPSNGISNEGALGGLASPPLAVSRQASSVSVASASTHGPDNISPSLGASAGKKRVAGGRNRLRDYYGLAQAKGDPLDIGTQDGARVSQRSEPGLTSTDRRRLAKLVQPGYILCGAGQQSIAA